MYYLLTEDFKQQETKLVEMITAVLPVEKIYLLGSTLQQRRTETVFMVDAPSCRKVSHYYLLVLVDANCRFSNNQLQDKIENTCRAFIPVTAIAMNIKQFTQWLNEGHQFATTVVNMALLIYDGNTIALKAIATTQADVDDTKKSYEEQFAVANEFIAGAELYINRKQNAMALFMLHQAAEQALHLILQKGAGLHINTHNIEKLLRYCSMVSYKIPELFNRANEMGERLFQLLQKAYITTRYKKEGEVSAKQVLLLLEKVKTLNDYTN